MDIEITIKIGERLVEKTGEVHWVNPVGNRYLVTGQELTIGMKNEAVRMTEAGIEKAVFDLIKKQS